MQMLDLLVVPLAAAIPGVPAPRSLPEEEEPSTTASGSPRSHLDRNDLATQRGQTKPEMAGRIQVGPLYCGLPIAGQPDRRLGSLPGTGRGPSPAQCGRPAETANRASDYRIGGYRAAP